MNELRLAFADKRSNFGPGNFFQEFSLHVERRGIAYVNLHGYESPPEHIGSDVDYGVVEEDPPKIAPLLATLPRTIGDWFLRIGPVEHESARNQYEAFSAKGSML